MIPYSRQTVTQEDIDEVVAVLQSDFLTQGAKVPEFERAVAGYCSVKHGVATCNGTAALHAACLALGIRDNDRVWVPAISFVATANCARYCGACVDFVDVDENTGLISIQALEKQLAQAKDKGSLPKLLIVVHLTGLSCDMKAIADLCSQYGVKILEDAAHALGSTYLDRPVGSCQYSDACIFSFHPVKPITTGEGGMIVTNCDETMRKLRLYVSHGIERNSGNFENDCKEGWYYEQQLLGFNYRLSDIHAALGLSQLSRLNSMVESREQLAKVYNRRLQDSILSPLIEHDYGRSSRHLYVVRFPNPDSRDQAFKRLREEGIGVNLHYIPIPSHPYYQTLSSEQNSLPGAYHYADTALSIPLYQGMEEGLIEKVVTLCETAL